MAPDFANSYLRLIEYACDRGWHEANGGNLSYLLSSDDRRVLDDWLAQGDCQSPQSASTPGRIWNLLAAPVPELAGACILISASGAHLRNLAYDREANAGVIEIDEEGTAWCKVCGFSSGTRPSSELETHLAVLAQAMREGTGHARIVYHAHAPQAIALSCILEPSSRAWSRALWKCMTEGIIVFPEGIGALPWMIPGSPDLAHETGEMMKRFRACAWAQHGLVVRATSFDEALGLVETIEKCASIYMQARAACGGIEAPHLVADDDLRAICKRYGLRPNESFLD